MQNIEEICRGHAMSTQITLTLSDEVYRRVERLAQMSNRDVADVLAETIELSVSQVEAIEPVSGASDEQVMAMTQLTMPPDEDQRLSLLLEKQQAGILTEGDRAELLALMEIYQNSLLSKAKALHEAVRRGLLEPLEA